MKIQTFFSWTAGLAVIVLPLVAVSQETSTPAQAPVAATTATNQAITSDDSAATNAFVNNDAATADATPEDLQNATGQIVSVASTPPPSVKLSTPANEVVKLAQAGVDDNVMLAYVTNSPYTFQLTSDDIIYLGDMGVSDPVVTAMLQRDQAVRSTGQSAATASSPPVYDNQSGATPAAPDQYAGGNDAPVEVAQDPPAVVDQTPVGGNVSSGYFYDSLSPYGTWIDIAGYGMCWQPTAVAANSNWQPYCDRGHWVYSDFGWYWDSDYSWGWAPFHYGRWFRNSHFGWCWAPDTIWGPSWVSWRYSNDYCGWAPLPPWAIFTPGFGFSFNGGLVGFNFGFGLSASCYSFVPIGHFTDRHPHHFRLPALAASRVFSRTSPRNEIFQTRGRAIINNGIPVQRVASATRSQIRPVHINTVGNLAAASAPRSNIQAGRSLNVYTPRLPLPDHRTALVGEGVKPAPRITGRALTVGGARNNGPGYGSFRQPVGNANSVGRGSSAQSVPTVRDNSPVPGRADNRLGNTTSTRVFGSPTYSQRQSPLILSGPDRGAASLNGRGNQPANNWAAADPNDDLRSRVYSQPLPAQNRSDWQNQRIFSQPDNRQIIQPSTPAPRQMPPQNHQWSPPVQPRQFQPRSAQSLDRPAPSYRSGSQNYSAPRGDSRQSAPQYSAPRNQGSSSGNSRRNN